ncbi:MAG: gliding motility-associated C-terminal domain-containing protein [Bacteroidales bacterium]|jgi:gliding motility-associated-like protein|nr:gliding motility-associated C-terminal domain-containing protein [Bacteroidales bacterium]
MIDRDKNFDYVRQVFENFEQQPDKKIWDNIDKHLTVKRFPYKSVGISAIIIVATAIAFLFFKPETPQISQTANKVKTPNLSTTSSVTVDTSKSEKIAAVTHNNITNNTPVTSIDNNVYFNISSDTFLCSENDNIIIKDKVIESKPLITKIETNINIPKINDNNTNIDAKQETVLLNNTEKKQQLIIPNAFTPTATSNNIFKPVYKDLKSYEMNIYNRNGQCIYHTNSIEQGWNGETSGQMCKDGTYIYVITFETHEGESNVQKGSFMLIK